MQAPGLITFVTEEEDQLRTLGDRVKWARKERGLSQAALGKAAGVSQGTIGNIEAGIRRQPREIVQIASALDASVTWLSSGKGEWQASSPFQGRKGAVFEDLTDDERRLLENFRAMLDDDQKRYAEEIADRAAKMRAYTAKVLEKVGATSKPAKTAADARRTQIARAALDVAEELRQKSLFNQGEGPGKD